MTNNERAEQIRKSFEDKIKVNKASAESWRSVGRNYRFTKKGELYVDLGKSLNGVKGVKSVEKNTHSRCWMIENKQGFRIMTDSYYPTITEIETKIQDRIELNERSIDQCEKILSNLDAMIAKCDEAIQTFVSVFPKDKSKDGTRLDIIAILWDYTKRTTEDWIYDTRIELYR